MALRELKPYPLPRLTDRFAILATNVHAAYKRREYRKANPTATPLQVTESHLSFQDSAAAMARIKIRVYQRMCQELSFQPDYMPSYHKLQAVLAEDYSYFHNIADIQASVDLTDPYQKCFQLLSSDGKQHHRFLNKYRKHGGGYQGFLYWLQMEDAKFLQENPK